VAFAYSIGLVVSVAILVYLTIAMLKPEQF